MISSLSVRPDTAPFNVDSLQTRLDRPDYSACWLQSARLAFTLRSRSWPHMPVRRPICNQYLTGAQINRDLNMRLQYLAGMGLNSMLYPKIFKEILSYR